ncbi:MAG: alkaline phosphatase family protein, partial [Nitrospiraceae bacterium]
MLRTSPGYDPVELFLDPALGWPKVKIAWILLKKQLGFRYLMDVIPLNAGLVRGSHGRPTDDPNAGPLIISSEPSLLPDGDVPATDVKELVSSHIFSI